VERLGFFLPLVYAGEKFGLALFTDLKKEISTGNRKISCGRLRTKYSITGCYYGI
jgi:hypothetical protein